jgi:DNA-binding response OmpR family regulator
MARSPVAVLVEDAEEYVELGRQVLRHEGYEVLVARDGETGVELARTHSPEFILVDLVLPGMDGHDVCRAVRQFSDAYLVLVTARHDESEKIAGLRLGADDYVTKPYSPAELSARIAAMRRRPRRPAPVDRLIFQGLQVDLAGRRVTLDEKPVVLTKIEFDLLAVLAQQAGRALTRGELLESLWGSSLGDAHVIDVHMANLRNKLGERATHPRFLSTVRGVGYRFDPVG